MGCVETITIIERKEVEMAEATSSTTISRRSTRLFLGQQDSMEAGIAGHMECESRHGSEEKEQERPQRAQKPQLKVPCPNSIEAPMIPSVEFGRDLCGVFPSTAEDMDDNGMLQCP
jgi:tyrosine-protein phosphatase SIW14